MVQPTSYNILCAMITASMQSLQVRRTFQPGEDVLPEVQDAVEGG